MQDSQASPLVAPQPTAPPATPDVSFGRLVARTFSTWSQNLLPFAAVALAIQIPILLVSWSVGSPFLGGGTNPFAPQSPEVREFLFSGRYWTMMVVSSLLGLVQMGALTAGAVHHLGGRRASVGEMLGSGLGRSVPILVSGVLALLAMYVGLVLLVVPGIIFGLMYSLTVPVLMAERLGPVKALGRSRWLTKGHRWKLLALFVIAYFAGVAPGMLVAPLVAGIPAAGMVATALVGCVMGPLVLVAPAVAYHDLRTFKEGLSTADLLKVFD